MYFEFLEQETVWVALAFFIFIALIWKKASKAVSTILDDRSILIQNELREAKSLKEEAMEELRISLQMQKNSSEEFNQIIKEAKEAAKKIKDDADVKSLETIKRREEQAKQRIMAFENEAIKAIKRVSGTVAIESAKIYIKTHLDKKENVNLITKASNEIKSSLSN
jgi:F-type H+-transporting ATPase subunit b|tara:strand:- start:4118 stop:4615 length:498 start_codon:yes stop_codon:yes gene_type:complete